MITKAYINPHSKTTHADSIMFSTKHHDNPVLVETHSSYKRPAPHMPLLRKEVSCCEIATD